MQGLRHIDCAADHHLYAVPQTYSTNNRVCRGNLLTYLPNILIVILLCSFIRNTYLVKMTFTNVVLEVSKFLFAGLVLRVCVHLSTMFDETDLLVYTCVYLSSLISSFTLLPGSFLGKAHRLVWRIPRFRATIAHNNIPRPSEMG